jgi:hypothetical protein
MRQFRTSGSVRGAAREGGPYRDKLVPCPARDLDPSHSLRTGVEFGTRSTSSGRALNVEPPGGSASVGVGRGRNFLERESKSRGIEVLQRKFFRVADVLL